MYTAMARPRDDFIRSLGKLRVDVAKNEGAGVLRIDDVYSATLSRKLATTTTESIEDKYIRYGSPKVADLSLDFLKSLKGGRTRLSKWTEQQLGVLMIGESHSVALRFNEEKPFLEWVQSRVLPLQRHYGRIALHGILRGVHSESFYKQFESMCDGVIEVRVMEHGTEVKIFLRVRSLRGQPHDTRWHQIEVKPNGEATLIS